MCVPETTGMSYILPFVRIAFHNNISWVQAALAQSYPDELNR